MTKEHKKLYKAGKNWVVATLTATTITLLGGIGAYTAHADATANNSPQDQQVLNSPTTQSNANQAVLNPSTTQAKQQSQNRTDVNTNSSANTESQPSSAAVDEHADTDKTNSEQSMTEIRDVTRTVDIQYFSTIHQTVRFTRNVSTSQDGKKVYGEWQIADGGKAVWPAIKLPEINYVYRNSDDIPEKQVTADTIDEYLDIRYEEPRLAGKTGNVRYTDGLEPKGAIKTIYRKITTTLPDNSKVFFVQKAETVFTEFYDKDGNLVHVYDGYVDDDNWGNVDYIHYPEMTLSASWDAYTIPKIDGYKSYVHSYKNEQGNQVAGTFTNHIDAHTLNATDQNVNVDISYVKNDQDSSKTSQNKTVARNIIIIHPDGTQTSKVQEVHLVRSVQADDVGGYIYGEWHVDQHSPKAWSNYSIPQLRGYDSYANGQLETSLPEVTVDGSTNDSFVIITYTRQTKAGQINYVDPDGQVVKSDQISGKVGDKVSVKVSLPEGYELADKNEQIPSTVTVGESGIKTITIRVKKIPAVKTGTVNYVDQDGKVVKSDKISGKVGEKIQIQTSLPEGYELANKDEQIPTEIIVTQDGIKTITINVKKIPGVQTGAINYVDPNGQVVKSDQISGKVGDKVSVKVSLPDGYELANKDESIPAEITVTEDGIRTITINVKKINTSLADNEVPYDSTTINNQVNANHGWLDHYRLTENDQGQAQLIASGWHATGASNSDRYRYMIVFDNTLGREIARQKLVPQVRSDVQRAYPNVDDSLYSGFNITIDIPNSSINHSLSLISRYSSDPNNGEGARVDHWFNSLAFNEGNQANLDGLSSDGNTLTVNGWHATNQAAGRPYHYIIAWDRSLGHEIARREVTAVSRPDVANVYSTVANAVNSGFSVSFNLTPQFFNDNIQFISRWTDDAAGNGNAVDYWFKPMNRTNRANLDSVALSNGQLQVAGWHATDLSQLEPNHYLIVFDNTTGQQVASEKVDLHSSQDVKNVFGDIQTADHSRFNYTFSSLHLIPGHNYSLVSRYSVDSNGNVNDGAHTDSWLNMGAFQQSAYSIDNVALNQRHMTVQGWLANDNAMTKPYAYAILIQNGREIGRQRLTLSERDDVAKVYPQIYRSQYSGFNANFDLPTFSTRGLQLVLRFTDDPAGNGNSSDNWINL